jgi:hypothetical protein
MSKQRSRCSVSRQSAEIVSELVRSALGKFSETFHAGASPQCAFFLASALPAFRVAIDKPRSLRHAEPLDRGGIATARCNTFLSSRLGDQRAINTVQASVGCSQRRANAFALIGRNR